MTPPLVTLDDLRAEGVPFYQVSRHSRYVARFPFGLLGKGALANHDRDLAGRLPEDSAGEQYLRCYAEYDRNVRRLSIEDFILWKKQGGSTFR